MDSPTKPSSSHPDTADNPYVGPRSFSYEQRELFFGREREARELLSLVISERLVLFYAQSGAGKSSLINTRLIPGLKEQAGYAVLPLGRVSGELPADGNPVKNVYVYNLLQHLDQSGDNPDRLANITLSRFLSDLTSDDGEHYAYQPADGEIEASEPPEKAPIHVLVIDQFEELLTTHSAHWQDRADFFVQLEQAMRDDPQLWVVLSMREDYVGALDPFARLLSGRLRTRYYMQRMQPQAALQAIQQPAAAYGRLFGSGVAEQLVDNLRQVHDAADQKKHPGQFIEPVQLQVVCYQLWQRQQQEKPHSTTISADDLNKLGDVDHALADFYQQALAAVIRQQKQQKDTGIRESDLRDWFEKKLITEARTRGTVFMGRDQTAGLSNQWVLALADQYLVRAEMRAGGTWYELVHDRFVEPILQANRQWLEQQSPLYRDAKAWDDAGRRDDSLLYRDEKLQKHLKNKADIENEGIVASFLKAAQEKEQRRLEQQKAQQRELETSRKFRLWFKITAFVAIFALVSLLWAGYSTYQQMLAKEEAFHNLKEANHNLGLVFNEKADQTVENKYFSLENTYRLYSIKNLDKERDDRLMRASIFQVTTTPDHRLLFTSPISHHHDGIVTSVAWSPDGQTLATGSSDKTIRLWDAAKIVILARKLYQQDNDLIDKLINSYPYQLNGIDLEPISQSPNLYGTKVTPPQWRKNHPFYWLSSAEQGDAAAMLELAFIYNRNHDYDRAMKWYQKAVAAGNPEAKRHLQNLQNYLARVAQSDAEVE